MRATGSWCAWSLPAAPVPRPGSLEVRVRELIAAGETPVVEFKSTLMWSTKGNVKDAKLQKMVTKTIAAFANTRGGTLLIGVEPDGGVCGIELDCAILMGKDDTCVDAFSRSLAAITAEHLGAARAARLAMDFVPVDGKTVCVVDVQRGREPVYLKADGVTEVYVRNGTTSVALPVSEIAGYVQSRWQGSPDRPAAPSPMPGATAATPTSVAGPLVAQPAIATRAEATQPAVIRQAPRSGLVGIALAQQALDVFLPRAGAYPGGIRIDELVRELGLAGQAIGGKDPHRTLRDALNSSQVRGVWLRQEGATWVPGTGVSKMNAGLSGRALAGRSTTSSGCGTRRGSSTTRGPVRSSRQPGSKFGEPVTRPGRRSWPRPTCSRACPTDALTGAGSRSCVSTSAPRPARPLIATWSDDHARAARGPRARNLRGARTR